MDYSTYIFDGDGVLYHRIKDEKIAIPHVGDTVLELRSQGKRVIILTNNAVSDPTGNSSLINGLYWSGEQIIQEDWIVSPLDVVVPFFEKKKREMASFSDKVMVLGGGLPLENKLKKANLTLTEDPKEASWVVVSEIQNQEQDKLFPIAYSAVHDYGAQIVATNSDPSDNVGGSSHPVTATTVARLRYSGKRPPHVYWLGKERQLIYDILFEKFRISPEERGSVVALGDRFLTDVYGANHGGIDSVFIESRFGSDHLKNLVEYQEMAESRLEFLDSNLYWSLRNNAGGRERLKDLILGEQQKYAPTYCIHSLDQLLDGKLEQHRYTPNDA